MKDRTRELNMLQETLQILEQGYYAKSGRKVQLKLSRKNMEEIQVYLPDDVKTCGNQEDFNPPYVMGRCGYGCENKDSFSLARERVKDTYLFDNDTPKILVLNLANPVNPGGGVRRGARAQEEDLCRCSSLLLSLESNTAKEYYNYNKRMNTYMGSDALMITPQVEIIRDENGELLDDTVIVSVVTCAAPMVSNGKEGMSDNEYAQMMYNRITGMLKCVAYLGYKNLVLGAWGCGAFGNDAAVISDLFYRALKEIDYNGHGQKDLYRRIDFAVLDRTRDQYNFKEFYRNFTYDNFYRDEKQRAIDEALERIKETEVNLDKIRGCLVGGAAGDALGYAIEFSGEKEIFSRYGESGITEYEIDRLAGKAVISDDTQMTLFTANGLLVGDTRGCMRGIQGWPRIYVARAYADWLRTQEMTFEESRKELRRPVKDSSSWLLDVPELYKRRAPGNTCLSALKYGKAVGDDFIKEHLNDSKGCGGVMRVAPLALNYSHISIDKLDYEGAQIAAITHGHSLGYMPAAVLTHIINRIVFSEKIMTLKEIVKEAERTTAAVFKGDKHLKELIDLIDLAVELSENDDSDLNNIHKLGEGWVAEETLAISIYCALRYQNDFSAGIIAAVNHKGDSDSTGAVTGNILGALLGYDVIEDKWKTDLELLDVILEMADDLCHGCQMSEYSDYEDPDWFRKYIGMQWQDETRPPADPDGDIQDFIQSPDFYIMNRMLRNGEIFSLEDDGADGRADAADEEEDEFVFFWKLHHKNEEFSNWYPREFVIEGIKYNCVEQYMMAKKAILFGDITVYQQIMSETDPGKCKDLGKLVRNFDPATWDSCKREIVFNANYAKFTQNLDLMAKLKATGDAIMAEASPGDKIWGIGLTADDPRAKDPEKWNGQNILGAILMEIRRDYVNDIIKYYSRSKDDNSHLYKYDTESGKFYYMDHCWTGKGIWYERDGGFPPEFEIVEISKERARTISKDNLDGAGRIDH